MNNDHQNQDRAVPEEAVLQNLKDAGCDGKLVKSYCEIECEARRKQLIRQDQIRLLYQHRKAVLEDLHACQKKLDCLDYLLHKLKQEEKENQHE